MTLVPFSAMMIAMRALALALLVLALPALAGALPDARLTPGVTVPMTLHHLCTTRWGRDARSVTPAMKREVRRLYGIPESDRVLYEIDHLIPRELGGADHLANLWPEAWEGTQGARRKDRLENRLHREVCQGRLSLHEAQRMIREDWTAAYRRYFPVP